jgi:uncharacterized protein (TIGR03067 family)
LWSAGEACLRASNAYNHPVNADPLQPAKPFPHAFSDTPSTNQNTMKTIICACLLVGASLSSLAAEPLDDAKAVQGSWNPVKAELAGQPMTDAILTNISLKLQNGKYEVLVGDAPDRGTYSIDFTTRPKSMIITGTAGPNSGKTFPAIYELKGDTLRICYDLSGAKQPTAFKSIVGTKLYLVTYRRKKE